MFFTVIFVSLLNYFYFLKQSFYGALEFASLTQVPRLQVYTIKLDSL